MGVMVPWQDILAKAKEVQADIVGLSGLITPSLEEMQVVAAEMEKDPWFRTRQTPLLIGGATTSRVHTAVKIAPHYSGPVVYVPDASRSVAVAQGLLGEGRAAYIAEVHADYERVRQQHANKKRTPLWPLAQARANATRIVWDPCAPPPVPKFTGRRVFHNLDLSEISRFIDWGPFFQTWDLAGAYPAILQDEVVGEQARQVWADAQAMLKKLTAGQWLKASAVAGFWPANAVDDDIVLWADETRSQALMTWYGLRQQTEKHTIDGVTRPSRCLADFVAPHTSGLRDHIGVFAVTAGEGVPEKEAEFLAQHDDYAAIMLKALADRLAEAAAEWLHWRVRTDWWGYAPDEALSNEALIAETYQGIRPAPGYPACPDHTAKAAMFTLLGCGDIGMSLTESLAMNPAASVSGFYISHPQSTYFNVGQIGEDQLLDMAHRRQMPVDELRRWLSPSL
jgi:5-methyltetrahydrofolate--homocysteine methyltransferase